MRYIKDFRDITYVTTEFDYKMTRYLLKKAGKNRRGTKEKLMSLLKR